jgi:hypothetical protein|eukprot:COSAG02_NODE_1162_length_14168_cov_10.478570_3_plen_108_part_00
MPAAQREAAIDELDREIKILTRRRAVLSGELYTLRGRFKAMGRDYGLPFMVWWTAVWLATGVGIFSAISVRALYHASNYCSLAVLCTSRGANCPLTGHALLTMLLAL